MRATGAGLRPIDAAPRLREHLALLDSKDIRMRSVAAVLGGVVAWLVVATLANLALRALLADYAGAERTMAFTFEMQAGRLVVGAVASLAAGFVAARIAHGASRPVWGLALVLAAVFLPVHYGLWTRFPLWYHLLFFASLLIATPAGAWLVPRGGAR